MQVLNAISGCKRNNNAQIEWTPELKQSFQRVKEHLAQVSLAFPAARQHSRCKQTPQTKKLVQCLQQYNKGFYNHSVSFQESAYKI